MTFVGKNTAHFFNKADKSEAGWKVIENCGRTLSSVKMFPVAVPFDTAEAASYLDYRVLIAGGGEYTLTAYFAPSNNLSKNSGLRYGVSFDRASPVIADSVPVEFVAGDYNNNLWSMGVLDNAHILTTAHKLRKGLISFTSMD